MGALLEIHLRDTLKSALERRFNLFMVSFLDAVKNVATNSVCSLLQSQQDWARFLDDAVSGGSGVIQQPGELAALQRQLCGQNPPPNVPTQIPAGGCSGVEYNTIVDWEFYRSADNTWVPVHFETGCVNEFGGPITGPIRSDDGTRIYHTWGYTDLSGGGQKTFSVNWAKTRKVRGFTYRYVRCDGVTDDDCDTNPVPPNDAYNYQDNITINFDLNPTTNIDLPIDITIGSPKLDINANIVIPIAVGYLDADLNVPVTINFTLDANGNLNFDFGGDQNQPGGGGGGGGCPPPKPNDAEPEDEPPESEDPDQTGEDDPIPANRIIRAAIVTVRELEISRGLTVLGQDDNPDIIIPAAGYIQFKIASSGTQAWTSDIPVKNIRNFIPCPWEYGAIDVRGTPREGVQWTITPVYSKLDTD